MAPVVKVLTVDAPMWREIGPRMEALEREEWRTRAFSRREMRWQATNRDAVVATSWDGALLVGFAIAGPAWTDARASLLNVLIDPAYRGQGLVWPLIAAVERELLARGIGELEIDARVENGFADAVERRYGSRAQVIEGDHASPYGPQRTIRITIAEGTSRPRRARGGLHLRASHPRGGGRGRLGGRRPRPTR